jgi:apolipoprotein N-acyltransferase
VQHVSVTEVRFLRAWPARGAMLLAGGGPILAFPAPNLAFLAWVALVPGLLLIVRAESVRQAGVRAWWFGAGYLLAALYWLVPEIGPALLLIAAVFGATWVPFGVAAHRLLRPPVPGIRAAAALLVVPSCWLLTEWIRSWPALGGPWAVYGAGQWQHPAVLALAAWGGVWLVSAAIVLVNTGIVLVVGVLRPGWLTVAVPDGARGSARTPAAAGLVAVLVGAGAGPVLFTRTPESPPVRQATVVMVQPGIVGNAGAGNAGAGNRNSGAGNTGPQSNPSETLTASIAAPGASRAAQWARTDLPDLVVWGESSESGADLSRDPARLDRIQSLSAATGADILADQDAMVAGAGKQKIAVLVGPAGVVGQYIKSRLVPFGEYVPFRRRLGWLTGISRAAPVDTQPGTGVHLLQATDRAGQDLPIGVLICFESTFPDMSRTATDQGAQLLVYQSATSSFQGTWGPDQHAALGAVRAAETGRPVVQAALTGDSVAFDGRGRELARLGQSGRGLVTVHLTLPAGSARTPYDRIGDCVPWAAVAIALAATLIIVVGSRPARTAARARSPR